MLISFAALFPLVYASCNSVVDFCSSLFSVLLPVVCPCCFYTSPWVLLCCILIDCWSFFGWCWDVSRHNTQLTQNTTYNTVHNTQNALVTTHPHNTPRRQHHQQPQWHPHPTSLELIPLPAKTMKKKRRRCQQQKVRKNMIRLVIPGLFRNSWN